MKYSMLLILSSLAILLSACLPDPVDIVIPQAESRLVISSQMIQDQVLLVQVGRSLSALDFAPAQGEALSPELLDQILVRQARVVVAGAGQTDTLRALGAGLYLGTGITYQTGAAYQLSVYDSVSQQGVFATAEVQPAATWTDLGYTFEIFDYGIDGIDRQDTTLVLSLAFEDLPGGSYYMINAYEASLTRLENLPDFEDLAATLLAPTAQRTFPLSDALYPGQAIIRDTLRLEGFAPGDTLLMSLAQVEETYFQYLTTRARRAGSLVVELLGEPVNHPSNVVRGYGMFALYRPRIQMLVLE
ncbi:MAG: DUF4249 family protein [Bacteroidetes bacterium]|nr:MAG: DUF4249 family protein [Bacteroidota bacterium]